MYYTEFHMEKPDPVIDLHMHSKHSDGSMWAKDLLHVFDKLGADIVSFTDHDSVGCYTELEQCCVPEGLVMIPGVELSFAHEGQSKDMLGYGIDVKVISAFLEDRYSKANRIKKQAWILERFKQICAREGLRFDEGLKIENGNKGEAFNLMYYSLNRYPENLGKFDYISDNTVFYRNHFADRQSRFFIDETPGLPTMDDVIAVIHHAGGLAFLAHPCAYREGREATLELIRAAKESGADGLEAAHSSNEGGDVDFLREAAHSYGLYISGGSDFHGDTKPHIHLVTGRDNMKVTLGDIKSWVCDIRCVAY